MSGPPTEGGAAGAVVDRLIAEMDGPIALPRRNGELTFAEPWEARAFGMAIALHGQSLFAWPEFAERLCAHLAATADDQTVPYYRRWLAALEAVLVERGVLDPADLDHRTHEFESGERDEVF